MQNNMQSLEKYNSLVNAESVSMNLLAQYANQIQSSNLLDNLRGTISVRLLVTNSKLIDTDRFQRIIDSHILQRLLSFFEFNKMPKLQFEAALIVTNLCSSDLCKQVCRLGAVDKFKNLLLSTNNVEIMDQVVWGLGNIAGDSEDLRVQVLEAGVLDHLLTNLESFANRNALELCSNCLWCIANLSRNQSRVAWDKMKRPMCEYLVPFLSKFCQKYQDMQVQAQGKLNKNATAANAEMLEQEKRLDLVRDSCIYAVWAFKRSQHFAEKDACYIEDICNSGLVRVLVRLMQFDCPALKTATLRTIGGFLVSDDDESIEFVLKQGYLAAALNTLQVCKEAEIRRETAWTLSNIVAGNSKLLYRVLDFANGALLKQIVEMCTNDTDGVRKETAWCISNMISNSNETTNQIVVKAGGISALVGILCSSVSDAYAVCLNALDILLSNSSGNQCNYISQFDCSGGRKALKSLLSNEKSSGEVRAHAIIILSAYGLDKAPKAAVKKSMPKKQLMAKQVRNINDDQKDMEIVVEGLDIIQESVAVADKANKQVEKLKAEVERLKRELKGKNEILGQIGRLSLAV